MAERTDERTREDEVGVDTDLGSIMGEDTDATTSDTDLGSIMGDDTGATDTDTTGGLRGRLRRRVGSIFSIGTFGIALVLTLVLAFVVGGIVPFVPDNISGLVGVFLGGFALGTVSSDRHYLEVGTAALMTGALIVLLSNFMVAVFGPGAPLVAFGAGTSGVAGVLGYYFGRDLRAGLTRDLE
ncbi:MAG: hypothetical protein V5A21_12775 [Halapricum sp.]